MLTDRLDFQAWLAKHDAHGLKMAEYRERDRPRPERCECCGGPLGDTPSRLREYCIVCLAERFGGDLVEEQLIKTLIGGMVKVAMDSEEIPQDLVVTTISDAIREVEHKHGLFWGRAMKCAREEVA